MDVLNFMQENFVFDFSLVIAILTIVLASCLAYNYHTERLYRNSTLANFVNWYEDQRFILDSDFRIKFFCRQEHAKKVFTIPAGSIFILCKGKAVFRLAGEAEVPEKIKLSCGTAVYNIFVFYIPEKLFSKTNLPISKAPYKVFNISEEKMEISVGC